MKNDETGAGSIIERTRVSLAMPRRAPAAKGQSRNLDFGMQHQVHSNWCWAAVATSIAHFYDHKSKWTQCRVANQSLGMRNCCGKGVSRKCNQIGHLQETLELVGHGDPPGVFIEGKVPFRRAQHEIDAGRPVGARTEWRDGGGHVVAIVGYHTGVKMLTVEDPFYGTSHVHYRVFSRDYKGSGKWTRSYCTKR